MPISVQCASCKANFKAPDQAAGKKVKCPKCTQPIVVPASSVAVTAGGPAAAPLPRQNVKAAPPAHQGASARGQLPPASFEELKVPRKLRRTIEEEVGSEPMVWLGRPTPESMFWKAKIGMFAGIPISLLATIGAIVVLVTMEDATMKLVIAGVIGLMLLTIGLPLATMPVWIRWLINFRDCYVLTPTRAIVFDNEQIVQAYVKSFTADELQQRQLHVNDDGSGSIVFSVETIDLGERTKRTTREKKNYRGEKVRVVTTKTKRERARKGVGFMDIAEVEAVEALLRQTLKLGPPAAQEVD